MAKINPAYLEALYKRCPHAPASGRWCQWISDEMEKVSNIEENRLQVQREMKAEEDRHRLACRDLNQLLTSLQTACGHESTREHTGMCAGESWTECLICGGSVK